jgi:XTP/dITP diphosphohydrolase
MRKAMHIPSVLNTSNFKKQIEFKRIFDQYNFSVTFVSKDIQEIVASPLEVIAHKASVIGEGILVEDTSLDLEGHDVGIHIKYLLDLIIKPETVGTKAAWTCLMAFCKNSQIYIFEGKVYGTIVPKSGEFEFGFAQYFLPDGTNKTMGQVRNDQFNARACCIKNMMEHKIAHVMPIMQSFDGYELQQ